MGIFDFFKRTDIDQGVKAYQETPGAILLDVRTAEEFRGGRIPDSNHVPLQSIGKVTAVVKDKSIPIFVYCQSGARSRMAANTLRRMGYESVTDIGGISAYSGAIER